MSFGLLKHFKDRKVANEAKADVSFKQHVLVGSDLATVLKLIELRRQHEHATLKLISQRPLNKQLLLENYQFGVCQLRSEQAVTEIYRSHHNARLQPQKHEAQFYKDGKFHDFSGRAKPMELKEGETFFTQKGYRLDVSSLFSEDDWNNLDQIINQHIDIRLLATIEKTTATDMVEKNEWLLTFKDFKQIACEHLYYALSPKDFLAQLAHKEKMTPDLIDFCSSADVQGALSITWALKKDFHHDDRTLFVPQSMTHEWGHFIFEFESFDYAQGHQLCHGLFLVHEEEPQAEDLATKIKLMKRVFDRVFPDFESFLANEYIRFDEAMFMSGAKDNLIEQLGFDYPTLKFLGQMAPVSHTFAQEKFLARALLS